MSSDNGVVDLDALRAARAEARGTKPRVSLGGEIFELVPEVPIGMIDAMLDKRLGDAVGLLLADRAQVPAFLAAGLSFEDLAAILKAVYRFGGGLGESSASPPSSQTTGRPSRPTSSTATNGTSAKPAGGRTRSGSAASGR